MRRSSAERAPDLPFTAVSPLQPRPGDISIYIVNGLDRYASHLARLGKHKAGKGCLYIHRLADVDMGVLKEMVEDPVPCIVPQRVPATNGAPE